MEKDIVLSVDVVEPELVDAVHRLSEELGRPLRGVVLVHKGFVDYPGRPIDTTGLFEEVIVDFDDPDEIQKIIKPLADQLLLVTTRYEDAIHHLRHLVPFVPYLHAPTESSLIWAAEKPLMRDRLRAYDERLVPKYRSIEQKDLSHWEELVKDFSYPVIVKPGSLWSSFLVTRCNTKEELGECLRATFQIIDEVYGRLLRVTKPTVLVEEFMDGSMYSTDAYVMPDGEVFCLPLVEVITAHAMGLPGFYSYRHVVPTGLPDGEVKEAFRAATDAVRALNLRATTAHIEMFRTPQGWKIIELGARIGGYRHDLYREAYGIDHYYNDLLIRMGKKPEMPGNHVKHAAGMNIFADEEGIITSIEGIEQTRQLPSMVFMKEHAAPGDKALFADKGGDLLVDGILSNASKHQLERDVADARKLVKVNVRKIEDQ